MQPRQEFQQVGNTGAQRQQQWGKPFSAERNVRSPGGHSERTHSHTLTHALACTRALPPPTRPRAPWAPPAPGARRSSPWPAVRGRSGTAAWPGRASGPPDPGGLVPPPRAPGTGINHPRRPSAARRILLPSRTPAPPGPPVLPPPRRGASIVPVTRGRAGTSGLPSPGISQREPRAAAAALLSFGPGFLSPRLFVPLFVFLK